jgi:NTE family protein
MKANREIGLVLSGGGVRGAAHAGILKALEEHGIHPTRLSGSSAGAMAGALYAAGFTPEDIHRFFRENANVFRWQHVVWNKPGILDAEQYGEIFEPWLNGHTFESLDKELHICVTDVLAGTTRFFSSGELVRPILASAAIPGVFTPVEIEGNWYIDGGTMNNFPVEPLEGQYDILVGSFVCPTKVIHRKELTTTFKLVNRATDLSLFTSSLVKFNRCDFVFVPEELGHFGTFDRNKVDEIFEVGYDYAARQISDLLELLENEENLRPKLWS